MNLEEFTSIQNKVIELVIDFEQTERKIQILNNAYIITFYKELEQQRYLQSENDFIIRAIAMAADGKTENEVKAFLNQCQNEFSVRMNQFQKGYQQALEIENAKKNYTQEDLEKTDQEFIEYCSTHHPLIKAYSSDLERNMYSSLIMLYRIGNLAGFRNMLKESRPNFTSLEVLEEDYDKIASLYMETMEHLNALKEKRNMVFPLNKEDIFIKEELITRELMELREKNYQVREMNQALQADFKLHFSFEFSL